MNSALYVLCFVSFNCFVYSDAVVAPNTTHQARRYVKDFVFPDALVMRNFKPVDPIKTTFEQQTRVDLDNNKHNNNNIINNNNSNNNNKSQVPVTTNTVNPLKTCADYENTQIIQTSRLLLTRLNDTSAAPIDNAVDYIRSLIANELDLFDVEYKILQAKLLSNNEILFEMATTQEALEILKQYCNLLKDTMWSAYLKSFKISETERNFFD